MWPPERARQRSVRARRFKLVEYPAPPGGYRRALYDLRSDPAEELDRADEFPAIAERLGARLDGWTAQLPPSWSSPLSKDALEALRALGYLQ